jgi:hypothetical protein
MAPGSDQSGPALFLVRVWKWCASAGLIIDIRAFADALRVGHVGFVSSCQFISGQ